MSRRAHPGYELKDQGFRSADLCRTVAATWICELKKTSLTDPLQIAAVAAGGGFGRVGITLCPGKCDPHAMSGEWERDLAVDLDAVRDWGATAVITLVEPKELTLLKVERLGEEVVRRNMLWFHLPIVDASIPDQRFEQEWENAGEQVRGLLRGGRDVLVHCRGGLGRAGMIAARLLVELGVDPAEAIARVRAVRPGAIETPEQERFVRERVAVKWDGVS
jgi:ADP-ribosyl-[dinitrogen reductase] hydrolase